MRPTSSTSILSKAHTDTFLVSNLTNIRYLTNVEMSAGLLLVKPRGIYLFADSRYAEIAEKESYKHIHVRDISQSKRILQNLGTCGFEADNVTIDRLKRWKKQFMNTKFVQKSCVIQDFRRTKSDDELKMFKRSQSITRKIMSNIPNVLKPGITERQVALQIFNWSQELRAEDLSFPPIVAFGSHSSRPHHHVTDRKLRNRDIVQIDCGVKYHGYCSDQSRVFFVGEPTAKQRNVYEAVERAKQKAEANVRAGITTKDLDDIARTSLKEDKLNKYFVHSLGHGVGLDIHEAPTLSSRSSDGKLRKNEIITIEPGVYIPGEFGIRLEDEIIVR